MTKNTPLKYFIFIYFILFFLFCNKKDELISKNLDPKYETPQKLVETYWNALFEQRYKDALMCFIDFTEEEFDTLDLLPMPDMDTLWIDTITYLKIDNDQAEIHYIVAYKYKDDEEERAILTGDKLKLTKEGWKIKDVIIP